MQKNKQKKAKRATESGYHLECPTVLNAAVTIHALAMLVHASVPLPSVSGKILMHAFPLTKLGPFVARLESST